MGAEEDEAAFRRFVSVAEPRLRRALVAAYGPDRGLEATAEALGYAWEHWGKGQSLSNPCGYLYRVGQSRTRISKRRNLVSRAHEPEHWVEPRLGSALSALPKRQRVAVVLVLRGRLHAHGGGRNTGRVGVDREDQHRTGSGQAQAITGGDSR